MKFSKSSVPILFIVLFLFLSLAVIGITINNKNKVTQGDTKAAEECVVLNPSIIDSYINISSTCIVQNNVRLYRRAANPGETSSTCVGTNTNEQIIGTGGGYYNPQNYNNGCGQCIQIDAIVTNSQFGTKSFGTAIFTGECKAECGQSCTVDNDCKASTMGFNTICYQGKCANPSCPTDTTPGSLCTCATPSGQCGDRCGIWSDGFQPLCGDGISSCSWLNNAPQCGGTNATYCIPTNPKGGYTLAQCTVETLYKYLKTPSGQIATTQEQILESCYGGPSPTPTLIPSPTPTVGQCLNITIYKNGQAVIPSTLQPGDQILIGVLGTNAEKARISINNAAYIETTTKNANGEFVFSYTMPANISSFSINGQIYVGGLWK